MYGVFRTDGGPPPVPRGLDTVFAAPGLVLLERLPRLNGSFFIAAYDEETKRLRLVADRYGSQTCFYAFRDGVVRFFPHLHDFLDAGFRARLDRDLMLPFLAMRCICGRRTVVEDVFLVPHGCVLEASRAGVAVHRHWSWQFDESRDDLDDPRAAVRKLRETFRYLAPFLDNDLVDFTLRVPLRWRTGQRLFKRMYVERFSSLAVLPTKNLKGRPLLESWSGWLGYRLARVLRRQVETLSLGAFPLASAHREQMRRKCVQTLDYDRLLRESAPLRTMVEARLGRLAERGVLDGDTIRALWAEHVSGEAGHGRALVALASIEFVLEAFVGRAVSQAGGSSSSRS